ncbi:MAG: MFS transporter [Proteobacteria bacterium]|nr:MFS transporter [Pseudomonadota bacterium]
MSDTPATLPRRDSQWGDSALDASIRDGSANAVMLGCGEAYLGPFGVFLQATTVQIGLLSALPQLVGAVMQWWSAIAMDSCPSRLRRIMRSVLVQALVWFPLAGISLALGHGPLTAACVIVLAVVNQAATGFTAPVWNSLIGDMVPGNIRGRFFGFRNRVNGLSSFVALTCAGLTLHIFERRGDAAWGFMLIFLAAGVARLISRRWLGLYRDPAWSVDSAQVFTFRQFLRRSPHSNFAKYVFYVGLVNLAVSFSAPYFALYMLRDLKFSYLEFTVVVSVATVTQFLMFRYWGELSDRFGNKKILSLCGWGISVVPALWLFSSHIVYLMLIQVVAGIIWAGFSLASSNFLFDAVSPPKRARCVAYQGLINGAAVLCGSLGGGFVAGHLPASFSLGSWTWAPQFILPVIFLLSGMMRFAAAALLLHKFREVRPVEAIRHRDLVYRVSHIRPIAGATFSLLTGSAGDSKSVDEEEK